MSILRLMRCGAVLCVAIFLGAVVAASAQGCTITPVTLPQGKVGAAYGATIIASGCTVGFWSVRDGALPLGLVISSAGVISGTPGFAGSYFSMIQGQTAKGGTVLVSQPFVIVISSAEASSLAISPASLSFDATAGGVNPSARPLTVSNAGGGVLNWSESTGSTWLSVSPSSSSAPATVSVSANVAGLPAGTYIDSIVFSSAGALNSPLLVPVMLTVSPQIVLLPVLSVSPSTLTFATQAGGTNPAAQPLSIANTGSGALTWSATSSNSWLSVSPASGTAPSSASISTNIAGLAAGSYSGVVSIVASGATGSPASVAVSLNLSAPPPPPTSIGIWTSSAELAGLPMSGTAWNNVKAEADMVVGSSSACPTANISDQESFHDTCVLAKALVFARTGTESYRTQVRQQIQAAIGTEAGARSLALGRNLNSYVISADLIDLPHYDAAFDTGTFRPWISNLRTQTNSDGTSLKSCSETKPQNWGVVCGASIVAVDAYLGDKTDLARAAIIFKGYLGDVSAYNGYSWSTTNSNGGLTWVPSGQAERPVNAKGWTISGHSVDGALIAEMSRCGVFSWPPCQSLYPWTGAGGMIVEAELLFRQGYDVYNWSDQAVLRVYQYLNYLNGQFGFWFDEGTTGPNNWQPWIVNKRYTGTNLPHNSPTNQGWNMSWTDWTHAGSSVPPPQTVSVSVSPTSATLVSGGMQQFAATVSGTSNQSVTWSATAGMISSTGLFTAPSVAAVTAVTVKATSVADATKSASAPVTVSSTTAPLLVMTTSLPGGTVGMSYSITLVASGGTTPYIWSVTAGALPGGLTLNSSTGAISGTPSVAGTFAFTVQVKDSEATPQTASASLSVIIAAAPPPTSCLTVSAAWQNAAISSQAGTFTFAFDATPSASPIDSVMGLSNGPAYAYTSLAVTPRFNPSGFIDARNGGAYAAAASIPYVAGKSYQFRLVVYVPGHTYSAYVTPAGGSEILIGANFAFRTEQATVATLSNFGVYAATGTNKVCNPVIAAGPLLLSITTGSLPGGTVKQSYSATLAASGGTTPFTWSIPVGSLPAGLALGGSSGAISGTPTSAATSTFTVQLLDSSSPQMKATKQLSISIAAVPSPPAPLAVVTSSLPSGTIGVAYSSSLSASGGTAPYSWSIASGALPGGLALSSAGAIGGMPSVVGAFTFVVKVTDATAQVAQSALSITIVASPPPPATGTVQTVFVILEENHNWSQITSSVAPYIWGTLIPQGAHANQYYNPPGNHPSEPNYIWLEAGANLGLTTDNDASTSNSTSTIDHLVAYMKTKNISWKGYMEDISGTTCPLSSGGNYAAKHDPFVFFQDVTNNESSSSAYCIAHVRPYTELATDLANNTVPRYVFITPNMCNDMHDCSVTTGDNWLKAEVPKILGSQAYKNNGALFITWDEGSGGDGPIGMIVLSPLAKVNYQNSIHYDHSSFVRTVQNIFNLGPTYLRNASTATDLSDFFVSGAIPPLGP